MVGLVECPALLNVVPNSGNVKYSFYAYFNLPGSQLGVKSCLDHVFYILHDTAITVLSKWSDSPKIYHSPFLLRVLVAHPELMKTVVR
jgi:hypothetical protein